MGKNRGRIEAFHTAYTGLHLIGELPDPTRPTYKLQDY